MSKDRIKARAMEFCQAHGLQFVDEGDGNFAIGQSSFYVEGVMTEDELSKTLDECLNEHRDIENVTWKKGLLYKALEFVTEGPIRSAIEDELGAVLDKPALDKIARVFYKYTKDDKANASG